MVALKEEADVVGNALLCRYIEEQADGEKPYLGLAEKLEVGRLAAALFICLELDLRKAGDKHHNQHGNQNEGKQVVERNPWKALRSKAHRMHYIIRENKRAHKRSQRENHLAAVTHKGVVFLAAHRPLERVHNCLEHSHSQAYDEAGNKQHRIVVEKGEKKGAYQRHQKADEQHHFLAPFLYHQAGRDAHYRVCHEEGGGDEACQGELFKIELVNYVRNQRAQDVGYEGNHKPEHHNDGQQSYSVESEFLFHFGSVYYATQL